MEELLAEYLDCLCRLCGAASARLRVAADGPHAGADAPAQVLLDCAAAHRPPAPLEFSLKEPASAAAGRFGWLMERRDEGCEWRMRRRINGLAVTLDIALDGHGSGFLQQRLAIAGEMAGVLENLLPYIGLSAACTCGDDDSGAQPFDPPLFGTAPAIVELKRRIRQVAAGDLTVLVCGESGTGKELVARNIHSLGPRRARPLVCVSCAEMPEQLLQSELFGSARGSFTGADRDRAGLIESAQGGTFFLDEIGELPRHIQAALLRVVQEREVRRIGEVASRRVDVRFVFATNRDLGELVRAGDFREDLYYRISAVRLSVPPLRERREDIALLALLFLRECARKSGHGPETVSPGALARLSAHSWPGNVRELRNEMERAAVMNPAERVVSGAMLSLERSCTEREKGRFDIEGSTLTDAIGALERRMIADALRRCGGNRTRTAQALGITRQGLLKKLVRLRIDPALPAPGEGAGTARCR